MKQISHSQKNYLIEAPLEVLHEQSMEWLEEIEFWKDEIAFFYKLLGLEAKTNPASLKSENAKIVETQIIHISAQELDELKTETESHEKFLSRIMDDPKLNDQLYKNRHRIIFEKYTSLERRIKELKQKLFQLVKTDINETVNK
jgi:hypothetical protein